MSMAEGVLLYLRYLLLRQAVFQTTEANCTLVTKLQVHNWDIVDSISYLKCLQ